MIIHPQLDGPFSVPIAFADEVNDDGLAVRVPTAWRDNRWNTTTGFLAAHRAALTPYQVTPTSLARVWAGDDPDAPTFTVALAFPDAQTAEDVLVACGAVVVVVDDPPADDD